MKLCKPTMKQIIIINTRKLYGGTIVLKLLCKLLQEHGIQAKIFFVHDLPNKPVNKFVFWYQWLTYTLKYYIKKIIYKCFKESDYIKNHAKFQLFSYIPLNDIKEKYLPFYNKNNSIIIYPEVVYGNFMNAKNVVRYLLYHYKWSKDKNAYGVNDKFICFRHIFNDWELNPEGWESRINFFDSDLYKQYNFKNRKGNCYILRKGRNRIDLPEKFDGPIIDFGMNDYEIVKIFNSCKYCYSYDTQTFYTSIAAVCGCIPIIIMEPNKEKKDYLGEDELDAFGIAYSDDEIEIEKALRTRNKLIKSLDFKDQNEKSIESFIEFLKMNFEL